MATQGTKTEISEDQMFITHMIEVLTEAGQLFEDDYTFKAVIKQKISELLELL